MQLHFRGFLRKLPKVIKANFKSVVGGQKLHFQSQNLETGCADYYQTILLCCLLSWKRTIIAFQGEN